MRKEYDLSKLTGCVRGIYYKRALAASNLVLIEPDLAKAFPTQESVNRALRLVLAAANAGRRASRRRPGEEVESRTRSHVKK